MTITKRGAYKLLLRKIIKKSLGNFYLLPFKVKNGAYARFEYHGSFSCGYYITRATGFKLIKAFSTSIETINDDFIAIHLRDDFRLYIMPEDKFLM